jgi:hypothetical protein
VRHVGEEAADFGEQPGGGAHGPLGNDDIGPGAGVAGDLGAHIAEPEGQSPEIAAGAGRGDGAVPGAGHGVLR